jgi:hypothetical protein
VRGKVMDQNNQPCGARRGRRLRHEAR